MNIVENSLFLESIDAILAERAIFNMKDSENKNILIVEGKDDVEVINKYYFLKGIENLPFRVCIGEDLGEEVSGKQSAIKSFNKFQSIYPNIMCLLDRDLDFILGINEDNASIIYYDYYELENYLFDKSVLKLLFSRYYDCNNNETFREILAVFSEISKYYVPISKLILVREICNKDKILEEGDKFGKIVELSKKDIGSIYANQSPELKDLDFLEKINHYLNIQLSKENCSHFNRC